jgi:AcrR family transcriptional regulator
MGAKTQKGEEMKQRILSSAQKLFHKKGFESTSVREIIEDVGCAKGTFYLYFETKIDLLYDIACDTFNKFDLLIENILFPVKNDPFLQIEELFNALVQSMEITEGSLRLMHTGEMLKLLESKTSTEFIDDAIGHTAEFIGEGVKRGFFRDVDTLLYARLIFNMCHNAMESAMFHSYPGNLTVVKDELLVIIRKILMK